jgi:hypothetical protein
MENVSAGFEELGNPFDLAEELVELRDSNDNPSLSQEADTILGFFPDPSSGQIGDDFDILSYWNQR